MCSMIGPAGRKGFSEITQGRRARIKHVRYCDLVPLQSRDIIAHASLQRHRIVDYADGEMNRGSTIQCLLSPIVMA